VALSPKTSTPDIILDSAAQLFAAKGFHLTTTRAIAARAGVNIALLNYYFKSKDGALFAVLDRFSRMTATRIRTMMRTGGDPWRRAQDYVTAFYQVLLIDHSDYLTILARESAVGEPTAISEAAALSLSPHYELFQRIVEEGADAGVFGRADASNAFAIMFGIAAVHGACTFSFRRIGVAPVSIDECSRICTLAIAPVLEVSGVAADLTGRTPSIEEFRAMPNTDLDFVD
jgi:AcrR family transcriptional regulator